MSWRADFEFRGAHRVAVHAVDALAGRQIVEDRSGRNSVASDAC